MKLSITCCLLLILLAGCSNEGTRCIDTYNQIGKEVLGGEFAEIDYIKHVESDEGVEVSFNYKNNERNTGGLYCPYIRDDSGKLTSEFDLMLVRLEFAFRNGFAPTYYKNESGIDVAVVSREGNVWADKSMMLISCRPRVGGGANYKLVLVPPKNKNSFSQHHLESKLGYLESVKLNFKRNKIGDLSGYAKVLNVGDNGNAYQIDMSQRFDGKNLLEFLLYEPQSEKERISDNVYIKHFEVMKQYGDLNDDFFIALTVGRGEGAMTYHFPSYDMNSQYALQNCANKRR